jgi:hypothetical protein
MLHNIETKLIKKKMMHFCDPTMLIIINKMSCRRRYTGFINCDITIRIHILYYTDLT